MQVTNGLSPADIASGAGINTPSASAAVASSVDALANKETFLQLLVAQIKNQDPLKPTDGIEFVTQLAQFSSLEQLIGIRGEIKDLTPATPTDTSTNDPTTTQTTQP
jgi:flagellar hook assembly protein FlgD